MNKSVKIIFWLLVAVNVIFFAVMKLGVFDARQTMPTQRDLHAEKIILLDASQVVAELAQSAPVAAVPVEPVAEPVSAPLVTKSATTSCYEWGEFSGTDLERAKAALNKLQLGKNLTRREATHSIGFWVYIAPQKDKEAIAQKIAQLKARGVTDYFLIQDAGEWLNAISLGMFKTREAAQSFLDGLKAKDVRTAQIGERTGKSKVTIFVINGLDAEKSDKLTALQKDFQGAELKSVSCH